MDQFDGSLQDVLFLDWREKSLFGKPIGDIVGSIHDLAISEFAVGLRGVGGQCLKKILKMLDRLQIAHDQGRIGLVVEGIF